MTLTKRNFLLAAILSILLFVGAQEASAQVAVVQAPSTACKNTSTCTLVFPKSILPTDFIWIVSDFAGASPQSVVDTLNSQYSILGSVVTSPDNTWQQIAALAQTTASGELSVTVTLTGTSPFMEMYAFDIRSGTIDSQISAIGTARSLSVPIISSTAADLAVATIISGGTAAAGTGFTAASNLNGNLAEWTLVAKAGAANIAATSNAVWAMNAATFKPPAIMLVAPSITAQPASQTVTAGQTATFSVVAAGTAPLSYQWQKKGMAISGATSASYTTPATTTSDSGATFNVVVTNSVGSVTSQAATLTVTSGSGPTVTVNWTEVHQTIEGFGASSAFTGDGISNSQADLFWTTSSGVGLSLLRVQIQPDGTYPDLATMQKARDRGVTIWGTPWSPPASMKTNGSTTHGGSLKPSSYQAYADYLANYVLTLKNSYGISLYALSIQNEPNFISNYDSCIWTGQQFHDFILNNLTPTFARDGVSAKIMMPEETGWSFNLATTTLSDPAAAAGVNIIAAHNYGGSVAAYPLGQGLGKELWQTEVSSLPISSPFDPSMTDALFWAQKIHDWMTVANANAWHYWWLIDGGSDNQAMLGPNGETPKRLYVLGNFSKFVRPGYERIGATAKPVNGVSISAYKDPSRGKFAIVAINHNVSSVVLNFALNGFTATSVSPWVTSSSLDLAQQPNIAVGNSAFTTTLPGSSVTTFVGP